MLTLFESPKALTMVITETILNKQIFQIWKIKGLEFKPCISYQYFEKANTNTPVANMVCLSFKSLSDPSDR